MELFCNYRCFTKDVDTIDTFSVLKIELGEIKEEPAFECRDAYFRNAFNGEFASKNRLNASLCDLSVAKGGRMKWFNFHHSFRDLVPEDIYFDTHPEYFSERDGKRERDTQLCLTNPEVYEIAERSLRGWIKNNPECRVFSVAQNDNPRRCTCKNCLELEEREGSPAGPIIHFVNRLADAIKDEYPRVLLHTFAYMYSVPAPKKVVARDNVIVRICSFGNRFDKTFEELAESNPTGNEATFVNALKAWREHASRLYVWDYSVNFRNYLQPFFHFHVMAENIRCFQRLGIAGLMEQGNFAYGGGGAFDELKAYIISRLLWNPQTDIDEETDRFFTAVYGKNAGEVLKRYLALMEKACTSAPLTIYQYPNAEFITDGLVEKSDDLFKEAVTVAENEIYRERIERDYLSIRFLKITRSELDTVGRDEAVDKFIDDVKHFGITEINERGSLEIAKRFMKSSRYAEDRSEYYSLYYIMQ